MHIALAKGAVRAILVKTDAEVEPLAATRILKAVVEAENLGLLIMSKQALDNDANQMLAFRAVSLADSLSSTNY